MGAQAEKPKILIYSGKVEHKMQNLTAEYLLLFNAITDAERTLDCLRQELISAQCRAEELYLAAEEDAAGRERAGA